MAEPLNSQTAAQLRSMRDIIEFSRSLRGIQQADRHRALVWVFYMRCGHAKLTSPRWLIAQVKGAPDRFDALISRLRCEDCAHHGVELIAVPPGIAKVPVHVG